MIDITKDASGQPVLRELNETRRIDRAINELLGLLRGVIADGSLTPREVLEVAKWLLRNREITDIWPANVITHHIAAVLERGSPSPQDCIDLQQLFTAITGPEADLLQTTSTILPLTDPAPEIVFPGRIFLFTGRFDFGSRKACQEATEQHGGACVTYVTRKVNYLVIGHLGSADWIYSSFGRKIQNAATLAATGQDIALVSEEHWIRFLA